MKITKLNTHSFYDKLCPTYQQAIPALFAFTQFQVALALASAMPIIGIPMTILKIAICLISLLVFLLVGPFYVVAKSMNGFSEPAGILLKGLLKLSLYNLFYSIANLLSFGFLFFYCEILFIDVDSYEPISTRIDKEWDRKRYNGIHNALIFGGAVPFFGIICSAIAIVFALISSLAALLEIVFVFIPSAKICNQEEYKFVFGGDMIILGLIYIPYSLLNIISFGFLGFFSEIVLTKKALANTK